jgi:Zn-finger nucleic acid-binding protein
MDLLACGKCARQYDVTHLDVGDLIRCSCDEVSAVPARGPLAVTGLACTQCGGTVRPDDEACPYCEAKLDQAALQSTTLCPKCFARIADDARHCSGCGITIHPQPLTPVPDGKSCPRCKGELQIRSLEVSDVIECGACQGVWIRADVFHSICRDAQLNGQVPLPNWPEKAGTEVPPGSFYVACLHCDQFMQRRQFKHNDRSTGIIIDLCRNHGIWLDHRELERITEHIRERGGAVNPLFEQPPAAVADMKLRNIVRDDPHRTLLERTLDFILLTFLS